MELGGTNDNKLQRRELMSRRLKQMRRESGGGERRGRGGGANQPCERELVTVIQMKPLRGSSELSPYTPR